MNFETALFFLVSALAIASAVIMVTRVNPVKSVLFLIVNFFCLAVLYLLLRAQFIAVIQILVYAGAIMVLFLFVIMLLNVEDEKAFTERRDFRKIAAFVLAGCIFVELISALGISTRGSPAPIAGSMAELGTAESVGRPGNAPTDAEFADSLRNRTTTITQPTCENACR